MLFIAEVSWCCQRVPGLDSGAIGLGLGHANTDGDAATQPGPPPPCAIRRRLTLPDRVSRSHDLERNGCIHRQGAD